MADSAFSFDLRQIEPGDILTGLSLGDPDFVPLKIFLEKRSQAFHQKSLAKTYAVFETSGPKWKIAGYVTLVCGEVCVEYDLIEDKEAKFKYDHYPAVKIARLAVDKKYRKRGIGESLVGLALGIAKDTICPVIGCRFVVVDSKKQSVSFYIKQGFSFIDTPANRDRSEPVMFIDLLKIDLSDASANTPQSPPTLPSSSPAP